MADSLDSGSSVHYARAGSSPASRTILGLQYQQGIGVLFLCFGSLKAVCGRCFRLFLLFARQISGSQMPYSTEKPPATGFAVRNLTIPFTSHRKYPEPFFFDPGYFYLLFFIASLISMTFSIASGFVRPKASRASAVPQSGQISVRLSLRDNAGYSSYSNKGNSLLLNGAEAYLTVRKESTAKQRENWVNEWYRGLLKEQIERLLPKWEDITGLHPSNWQTKYMTTRWGTCNTNTGKIWLNLQLAKKPIDCLEYVILHELAHLKVRNHGEAFIAIMDEYMPYWRETRKKLNDSTLDYLPEGDSYADD